MHGNACFSMWNSWTLFVGVHKKRKPSPIRFSFKSQVPLCMASVSCIEKPIQIRSIMLMLKVAIHFSHVVVGVSVISKCIMGVEVTIYSLAFQRLAF